MHSPTTQVSTHASVAASVHANPQGAAADIAAAQAQAAAAQAELAQMRQQMARMAAERGHDGLERRDERDRRGATQLAHSRDTPQHLEAAAHEKQISATAAADTSRPLLRDFTDPSHPQHALYNTLKEVLPEGTSPRWVAQATAACYMSNIRKPGDLGEVHGINGTVLFKSTSLLGQYAALEATQPLRTVQQTMQDVQQYDQQRGQMMSEMLAQNAAQANQQQGPVLGGR